MLFKRGCIENTAPFNAIVSKSCPLDIEREIDGEKYCFCETDKCNDGLMNHNKPTKKCIYQSPCRAAEDCGEGGYCLRHW